MSTPNKYQQNLCIHSGKKKGHVWGMFLRTHSVNKITQNLYLEH